VRLTGSRSACTCWMPRVRCLEATLPKISQLSPSTILRYDTYESVLGNATSPVAPIGLAPQAPISLRTLNFPCLSPPPSLPAQTEPPTNPTNTPIRPNFRSDPIQSTSLTGRPACSERVSKRKRKCSVSGEEGPDPHTTSQLQAADHGLHSSTTIPTPQPPSTSRTNARFHR
jgi:hypothetical protein